MVGALCIRNDGSLRLCMKLINLFPRVHEALNQLKNHLWHYCHTEIAGRFSGRWREAIRKLNVAALRTPAGAGLFLCNIIYKHYI